MSITALDVVGLGLETEWAPTNRLLTRSNPKTAKGVKFGYLTAVLHLAPHKAAGFNVCAGATPGCIAACLNTSGRGSFDVGIQVARLRKTKWWRADRDAFLLRLERELDNFRLYARSKRLRPAVRLNATSDLPWESIIMTWADGSRSNVFQRFPRMQFYDYSKVATRFKRPLPANYDLTFSAADGNERAVAVALEYGARVAMVFRNADRPDLEARFWELPASYNGRPIVNGDMHDLRFLEPAGVVVGLKAKGLARFDTTGFVKDIRPAGSSAAPAELLLAA